MKVKVEDDKSSKIEEYTISKYNISKYNIGEYNTYDKFYAFPISVPDSSKNEDYIKWKKAFYTSVSSAISENEEGSSILEVVAVLVGFMTCILCLKQ